MQTLQGRSGSPGVAFGVLQFYHRANTRIVKRFVQDRAAEMQRFENARALAVAQLAQLAVDTENKLGKENSLLFEIHQMMLDDTDYHDSIVRSITTQGVCAEWAVQHTAKRIGATFLALDDEYMRGRAADVRDVSQRVINILCGEGASKPKPQGQLVVMAADEFSPSETAGFDRASVMGIAVSRGSAGSHSAIFARTMGIPGIINLGDALTPALDGKQVALDGDEGILYVEPDEATMKVLMQKQDEQLRMRRLLEEYRGKPAQDAAGRRVRLLANISAVEEANIAVENDAEGVGLLRSEFLFLHEEALPDEDTQYAAYRDAAAILAPRPLTIRTLDIGADAQPTLFDLPAEDNPALGLRAIRVSLLLSDVFKTQLRAVYRASVVGNLSLMLPLVSSEDELLAAKDIAAEVREELAAEGADFDAALPIGVMVETPAAALVSDILCQHVDFVCIGTNDLVQFTLAMDRHNPGLDRYANPRHPAVLQLIETVVKSAKAAGISACLCGDVAADLELTDRFLAMGVDALSVAPGAILPLRQKIRRL